MNGFTVTGGQVVTVLAVLLVVVLVAVAGRVLLAAAVIAGAQWAVITYWPSNTTLVWVVLGVPALLAGYTLADSLTGSTGLGELEPSSGRPAMSASSWMVADRDRRRLMVLGLAMIWAPLAGSGRRRARAHRPAAGCGAR